jgi:uncharacterized membrane protein YhaH (DUF805 family)
MIAKKAAGGFWCSVGPSVLGGIQATTTNPAVVIAMGVGSFIVAIWGLIELGFLRGTVGQNRYGADLLQAHEPVLQR